MGPVKVRPPILSGVAKLKLPIRNGSIRYRPCGPFVMLTGCDRLFRNIRMISPKPSVTMAR